MNYVFQFNVVWDHMPELLYGAWLTIRLSATAMVLGLCVAIVCAYARSAGPLPVRWPASRRNVVLFWGGGNPAGTCGLLSNRDALNDPFAKVSWLMRG